MSYGDEKFPPQEQGPIVATPTGDLLKRAGDVAQVYLQCSSRDQTCVHTYTHDFATPSIPITLEIFVYPGVGTHDYFPCTHVYTQMIENSCIRFMYVSVIFLGAT